MINYEPNAVLSTVEYRVVGKRPVRHDGADKVTGKARYGADMGLPGMLYGAILRSPHAHARIVSIDTSRAAAVKAVVTAADFPDPGPAPGSFQLLNLMARDKVHYKGHALAAVASVSPQAAWDALELIRVEYEPLPVVLDAEDAMADGAPTLFEDLQAMMDPESVDLETWPPNVAKHLEQETGDLAEGFSRAEIIVERHTSTCAVHQGYIEPHAGTDVWHENGRLTVYSSSQGYFSVRDLTAQGLCRAGVTGACRAP